MRLRIPRPTRISTDPLVNSDAVQVFGLAFDTLEKVVNGNVDTDNLATGIVLQLNTTGTARKIAFGTSTLTWPGATPLSNITTVAHGLGVTPVVADAIARDDQGGDVTAISIDTAPDATNVKFRANSRVSPGSPSTTTLYWWAIG